MPPDHGSGGPGLSGPGRFHIGIPGTGSVPRPAAAVSARGSGRRRKRVRPLPVQTLPAGLSLVLEGSGNGPGNDRASYLGFGEKSQKILKISLFNWAEMGYNIR